MSSLVSGRFDRPSRKAFVPEHSMTAYRTPSTTKLSREIQALTSLYNISLIIGYLQKLY